MKLVVQVPCLDEEATLAKLIERIPRTIDGIATIEVIVVDDGSADHSVQIARQAGAFVVELPRHMGLARAFCIGVQTALTRGADILVNVDGDLQYPPEQIPALIAPIVEARADFVVGDRLSQKPPPFSPVKMLLERLGTLFVRLFAGVPVRDAASGFRAFSRDAMERMFVHGSFSYTLETLVMAGMCGLRVVNVPITTNPTARKSRLFRSIPGYISRSVITVVRAYLMYHPLKVFASVGCVLLLAAAALGARFLLAGGLGHVQSLIVMAIVALMGFMCVVVGMLGDVIAANRRLLEDMRRDAVRRGLPSDTQTPRVDGSQK